MTTYISLPKERHGFAEFFASIDERGASLLWFKDNKKQYIDLLDDLARATQHPAVSIRAVDAHDFCRLVSQYKVQYNTSNVQVQQGCDEAFRLQKSVPAWR